MALGLLGRDEAVVSRNRTQRTHWREDSKQSLLIFFFENVNTFAVFHCKSTFLITKIQSVAVHCKYEEKTGSSEFCYEQLGVIHVARAPVPLAPCYTERPFLTCPRPHSGLSVRSGIWLPRLCFQPLFNTRHLISISGV